ncbi:MAG TPA: HlyD family secretion protein [Opitutaceae bacterium]|jgi:membrane fusion protein (multidrug efflux system)
MNAVQDLTDIPSVAALTATPGPSADRAAKNAAAPAPGATRPARRRSLLIAAAAVVAGAALGGYYWRFVAPFESTDDAFIEADVTPIASQVAGRVLQVPVSDNEAVRQGAVLFEIDPGDYETRLDQARAGLAAAQGRVDQAVAQESVDRAKVDEEKAGVAAADAQAKRAEADFQRFREVGSLAVSASQVDLADTQARSSAAEVAVALNKERAVEARLGLDQADIRTARAEVQRSQAAASQAALDLSYTRVVAPVAGFVTHRGVQPGDYVQVGQPQLALVPRQVWIVANFKETQLEHMRPGQPVAIRVDAYPDLRLTGHVDSIQAGAGARFSLFPPENASGNYVKVVQRVPVKIALDDPEAAVVLGPGMSVVPEVRVR